MDEYHGIEAIIDVLNANGVDKIFFNPGGEQSSLLAAIAKHRLEGKTAPQLVVCLDESVALSAAHGHHMVSGRPQFVMVHAELGTQQIGGALHNAQGGRIPVIIWAGTMSPPTRTPSTGPSQATSASRSRSNSRRWSSFGSHLEE